jgi:hypothetical protein
MQFTKFKDAIITNLSDSASPLRWEISRSHWFVSLRTNASSGCCASAKRSDSRQTKSFAPIYIGSEATGIGKRKIKIKALL